MKVNFNKNVFYTNEVAQAFICVDNSECGMAVSQIKFELCQSMNLMGTHNWAGNFTIIQTFNSEVIAAKFA